MRRYLILVVRSIYMQLLFGGMILSFVIWRYSPYLGTETWRPFDGVFGRVVLLGVFWALILLIIIISLIRKRRKNRKIEKQIVESVDPKKEENEAVAKEVAEMRGKLRDALTKLRKTKAGGGRSTIFPGM